MEIVKTMKKKKKNREKGVFENFQLSTEPNAQMEHRENISYFFKA